MGFRFQRRINLAGGWGVNASGSGGSVSYRSRHGSIGTKGFSLRTGIPGLSFRQGWGKNGGAAALIFIAIMAALVMLALVVRVLAYLIPLFWQCVRWVALTLYDLLCLESDCFGARLPYFLATPCVRCKPLVDTLVDTCS
jgi:hypothetical protein